MKHRVHHVGCDLDERLQDEATLMKTRVRDGQAGFIDDQVGVEHEIEIDDARPPPLGGLFADAPEGPLDGEHGVEKGARAEGGADHRDAVEVRALPGRTDRFGLDEARAPDGLDLGMSIERGACCFDDDFPIAEVRTEGDKGVYRGVRRFGHAGYGRLKTRGGRREKGDRRPSVL